MHRQNCGKGDEEDLPLPLPSLRLLVPPLRLVSAAIWQTVQQKVVTDYGMLEEFITMTTEIVPGLLNQNQRAQLLLGLRARLILEHCHSEPMADLQTIQPHLDRMQILMTICGKEATNVEDGLSRSDFLEFILTLLKDPDERQHFFQDVFPLEFGPKYDRAIQTLVWQFLSRLEKLLSVPQLKEVASILSNAQSVLEECVGSVTNPQELKILLEYQKAHSQLEENDSELISCGECILRALSLPPVERIVNVSEQTGRGRHVECFSEELMVEGATIKASTGTGLGNVYLVLGKIEPMHQGGTEEYGNNKSEDIGSRDIKDEDAEEKMEGHKSLMVIGEDEIAEPPGVMGSDTMDIEKKSESHDITKCPLKQAKKQQRNLDVTNVPTSLLSRSERPNRGLKMKTFLAQERRPVKIKLPESEHNHPLSLDSDVGHHQHISTEQQTYQCLGCKKRFRSNLNLNRHMCSPYISRVDKINREFKCTVCGKTFPRAAQLKCHMLSHSSECPYPCSNCERSFKHISSMKAHEEACLFASQQRRQVSSGRCSGNTAMLQKNSEPLNSLLHQTSPGETTELLDNVQQAQPLVQKNIEQLYPHLISTNSFQSEKLEALELDAEISDPFSRTFHILPLPKMTEGEQPQKARASLACSKTMQSSEEAVQHRTTYSSDVTYNCPCCHKTYKYLKNFQKHSELCKKGTSQTWDENEATSQELSTEGGIMVSGVPTETPGVNICGSSVAKTSQNKFSPGATKQEICHTKSAVDGKKCCASCPSTRKPVFSPRCDTACETREGWSYRRTQTCKGQSVNPNESLKRAGKRESRRCDECGKEFGLRSTLRAHKVTHQPLYCAECRKVCRDAETLAVHNLMHRPVSCTMCDKSFNVVRFLIKHYLDAHQFSGPFVCARCHKSYSELGALIRHERTHTGDLPFHCTRCPKRFNRHIDLVSHVRKHTGEKRFLCWECGRAFSANEMLKKHMERHSGQQKAFTCPQCKRTFWAKKALDAHVQIHHKGMRFPCPYCSKLFLSRSALSRHSLIHTGEKPFMCTYEQCAKSFRSSAELRIHTRYHTGERPFKCQICEKGFVQAHYLTIHVRSHTQDRPYACPNCERRFTTGHQLNRHKLVHTGERPFKCEFCDEGFSRKHRLKAHQDKYHK